MNAIIDIEKSLENSRKEFNHFLEDDFLQVLKQNYQPNTRKITSSASNFVEILEYALTAQGKRLRPYLLELGFYAGGGDEANLKDIRYLQLAVESLHTYSLIHDDLPALDNDSLRRGRKTTHIVYGEANALLAGDSLNSLSFFLLSRVPNVSARFLKFILELFHNAVNLNGMITGQFADLLAEGLSDLGQTDLEKNLQDLEYIHLRKTGALIAASFLLGYSFACYQKKGDALFSLEKQDSFVLFPTADTKEEYLVLPANYLHADFHELFQHWESWFLQLGLLFQIRDDLLDEEIDNKELGKSSGKDKQAGKLTFATYYGSEKCRQIQSKLVEDLKTNLSFAKVDKAMIVEKEVLAIFPALVDYIALRKY